MRLKSAVFVAAATFALLPMTGAVAGTIGPDIIVGDVGSDFGDIAHWGVVGDIHSYSAGTTSCNMGDMVAQWQAGNNQHPVIAQNLYKLKNGRLEQIGMSWLKHAFSTVNSGICGTCDGQLGSVLGIHCADPYGAGLNGSQGLLGPRSEVNAATGQYPYPYIIGWQQSGDVIYKRTQVHSADLEPGNPNVQYFVEAHYVSLDDATWGNGANNASYRRIALQANLDFDEIPGSPTQREKPAILAWVEHGLGANTPDPDVQLVSVDIPGDGRVWVGSKATSLGNDMWHYEYAVFNLDSDRSVQALRVPRALGGNLSNISFHSVDYHSGEPYTNASWTTSTAPTAITWSTQTFAQNANANALRWGTLYNYGFDSDAPPLDTQGALTLFKPGANPEVMVDLVGPDIRDCNTNGIPDDEDLIAGEADCNANGSPDICDLVSALSSDCNTNANPDECDIDSGASFDIDTDTIADECDNCVGVSNPDQANWLLESIEIGNSGQFNAIAFDSSDRLLVAHYKASGNDVRLWHDVNGNFKMDAGELTTPDATNDVGQYLSLAVSSAGRASAAYYDNSLQVLKFWHDDNGDYNGGAGEVRTIDSIGNVGRYTSLKYDANGRAVIAYYARTARVLKLWYDANGNLQVDAGEIRVIDNTSQCGEFAAMVIDSTNHASVSYHDESVGGLRLWHDANGNFALDGGEIQVIETGGANLVGRFTTIARDSNDRVVVAHYDATAEDVRLWYDLNGNHAMDAGEASVVEGSGAVGQYPSIQLDDADRVVLSYYRHGNQNAILWHDANGDRVFSASERTVIDAPGDVGSHSALILHPTYRMPIVAYRDATSLGLKVTVSVDWDADGTCFYNDNCQFTANSDQADTDGDGAGDACDPCPSRRLGDVSGDNNVDALDAPAFVSLLLNPGSGTADDICAADVNADGVVDGLDVNLFVEMILVP